MGYRTYYQQRNFFHENQNGNVGPSETFNPKFSIPENEAGILASKVAEFGCKGDFDCMLLLPYKEQLMDTKSTRKHSLHPRDGNEIGEKKTGEFTPKRKYSGDGGSSVFGYKKLKADYRVLGGSERRYTEKTGLIWPNIRNSGHAKECLGKHVYDSNFYTKLAETKKLGSTNDISPSFEIDGILKNDTFCMFGNSLLDDDIFGLNGLEKNSFWPMGDFGDSSNRIKEEKPNVSSGQNLEMGDLEANGNLWPSFVNFQSLYKEKRDVFGSPVTLKSTEKESGQIF
ncbi:hypothetical protein BB558_004363 [Smittium angustum]|nr:hypothetical protein BB558_004363 [Smittium angustum]